MNQELSEVMISPPAAASSEVMPAWKAVWYGRVHNVPAVLWGRWVLRHATSIGHWTRVRGRPRIFNKGTMIIGSRVNLYSTPVRSELVCFPGAQLVIGDRTFINYGVSICATSSIQIGHNCAIGNHCIMLDNDFHSVEMETRSAVPPSAAMVVGNNVWLGVRVIVLKGVHIGDGAVIGAGSVVTHDIPPRSLAAGVPARVIRTF